MEYAIEVQGLTKHYPGFTLDHVSFSVPAGSIVGFIGENGAGKRKGQWDDSLAHEQTPDCICCHPKAGLRRGPAVPVSDDAARFSG